MKNEQIIDFAISIISTGVEKNLSVEKIQESLTQFRDYLNNQQLIDDETLVMFKKILSTLPELIKIMEIFGVDGVNNLILNMTTKNNEVNDLKNSLTASKSRQVQTSSKDLNVSEPIPVIKPVINQSYNSVPQYDSIPQYLSCGSSMSRSRC